MSITYPLSLPSTLGISRFAWTNFNSVGMMRSPFTYHTQVQQHQGQLWAAEVTIAPTSDDADIAPWEAFIASLMGPNGTFYLGDPRRTALIGAGGGTPLVNGGSQTGNTLVTDGWTISVTGLLKAGDYIQLSNHLHMVLKDVNSNGSGQATLDIWPRLRESPANDSAIVVANCVGAFRLSDSEIRLVEMDTSDFSYAVSFSAVEAI